MGISLEYSAQRFPAYLTFSWCCYIFKILLEIIPQSMHWSNLSLKILVEMFCPPGKKLGGGADLGSDSSRQDLGEIFQTWSDVTMIPFTFRFSACLFSLWCRSWSISGMRLPREWSTASPTTRTPPNKSTSHSTSDSWSISSSGYVGPLALYFCTNIFKLNLQRAQFPGSI